MKRTWVLVLLGFAVVVGLAAGIGVWASGDKSGDGDMSETTSYTSERGVKVTVTQPRTHAEVSSPLHVEGRVPGTWSFEANFGVDVVDAEGKRLAEHYATVQGDWMTEDDVPFTADVKFKAPSTDSGFVVLHKANPEGGMGTDDSVKIPIHFTR
jgi:hypothetical protein